MTEKWFLLMMLKLLPPPTRGFKDSLKVIAIFFNFTCPKLYYKKVCLVKNGWDIHNSLFEKKLSMSNIVHARKVVISSTALIMLRLKRYSCDLIWFVILVWFDLIWFDLIWFDLIWFDLIWFDLWIRHAPILKQNHLKVPPQFLEFRKWISLILYKMYDDNIEDSIL